MAPHKVKVDAQPAWYEPALDAPNVSEKNLAEKGDTELRVGSAEPEARGSTFYPFFMNAIIAGLVPPYSDFFYAVLRHYRLQALHLHPNSVLLLSIFAYYCEAHVGVMPSVALLRHFFSLRIKWVMVEARCIHPRLVLPMEAPHPDKGWSRAKLADDRAKLMLEKMNTT